MSESWADGPFLEVFNERIRQDERWGEQNHPDNFYNERAIFAMQAEDLKVVNDLSARDGDVDWTGILLEEVFEAVAESDAAKLRAELIQVAAVAVAWIEAIDRRG